MAEPITRAKFANTNGQNYQLKSDSPIDIKLIEVTECKDCGGGFESYSLLFEGDEESVVPQSTYDVQNDAIGEVRIFISPIHYPDGDSGKAYYQAIFSAKKS